MIRTLSIAALAASALALSSQAKESVVIEIAGVNFADSAQAEAVYDKIVAASREVCSEIYLQAPVREVGLSQRLPLYATCVKETVDGAVEAAGQPVLTALNTSSDVEALALADAR